jgi:hypothetical protein
MMIETQFSDHSHHPAGDAPATLVPLLAESSTAQDALQSQAAETAFAIGVGVASGSIPLTTYHRYRARVLEPVAGLSDRIWIRAWATCLMMLVMMRSMMGDQSQHTDREPTDPSTGWRRSSPRASAPSAVPDAGRPADAGGAQDHRGCVV